jgi:hypothetical protein
MNEYRTNLTYSDRYERRSHAEVERGSCELIRAKKSLPRVLDVWFNLILVLIYLETLLILLHM